MHFCAKCHASTWGVTQPPVGLVKPDGSDDSHVNLVQAHSEGASCMSYVTQNEPAPNHCHKSAVIL